MKVKLILKRNYSAQYQENEYVMHTECKTVDVDLPNISNEDTKRSIWVGEWQIVGYEEIEAST